MSAKRTERLLSLVMALMSSRRGFSRQELFEEIELYRSVSSDQAREKLFDRDKATLREQGIPVETLPGDSLFENESASQRYRINVSEYRLEELHFSAPELTVLTLAARMWEQAAFGSAAQRALRKVSLRSGEPDEVELPLLQPRLRTSDPYFNDVWRATAQHQRIQFDYAAAGADAPASRTVQPWGMGSRFGHWYLVGFDESRQAERYFRLSRFSGGVSVLDGDYTVPAGFSIHSSLASLDAASEKRTAVLAVRQGAGHSMRLKGQVTAGSGNTDTVELPFTDLTAMSQQIAALGGKVTVVEPMELREAVHGRLRAALDRSLEAVPPLTFEPVPQTPPRGTRASSEEHLGRLLDLVPYVMNRPGVDVAETARHFGVSTVQLVKDLNLLFVSGPRHYPDHLLDVSYEDNRIFIDNADKLAEPVRLAMDEAYALIVGLESLKSLPGVQRNDAVDSALDKLAGAAGGAGYAEGVLGSTLAERSLEKRLDEPKGALETRRQVELTYLVPGRDEITRRFVDPLSLFSRDNDWYLEAWCRSVDGLRHFRLDRIVEVTVTDLPAQDPPSHSSIQAGDSRTLFTPTEHDVDVTLLLTERAGWIAESYQARATTTAPDGRLAAIIAVSDTSWVAGFVASHGGDVAVADPEQLRRDVQEWIRDALRASAE